MFDHYSLSFAYFYMCILPYKLILLPILKAILKGDTSHWFTRITIAIFTRLFDGYPERGSDEDNKCLSELYPIHIKCVFQTPWNCQWMFKKKTQLVLTCKKLTFIVSCGLFIFQCLQNTPVQGCITKAVLCSQTSAWMTEWLVSGQQNKSDTKCSAIWRW